MIESLIASIEDKYDGDNDLIPGAPWVTATDYDLLSICEMLLKRVKDLELEVSRLKGGKPTI